MIFLTVVLVIFLVVIVGMLFSINEKVDRLAQHFLPEEEISEEINDSEEGEDRAEDNEESENK